MDLASALQLDFRVGLELTEKRPVGVRRLDPRRAVLVRHPRPRSPEVAVLVECAKRDNLATFEGDERRQDEHESHGDDSRDGNPSASHHPS
jgi:hypothetical protein